MVDGYVGGGSAAGDFTDGVGRIVAIDVTSQLAAGSEGLEGSAGGPAAIVAVHSHNHVVGSVPSEAGVEGDGLPVGVVVVEVAREDQLEVVGILDEAVGK